jgi:AraC-like DNA-binding protein
MALQPSMATLDDSGRRPTLLVGRDRIFFSGRLRETLEPRTIGAFSIYAAADADFSISLGGEPARQVRAVAVPPHVPHHLHPPRARLWNLLIEPESSDPDALALLSAIVADPHENRRAVERLLGRFAEGDGSLQRLQAPGMLASDAFDRLFFGCPLPPRAMDRRTVEILRIIEADSTEPQRTAEDCAARVGLSVSRMLRLFKTDTGVPFRKIRMWKRARRFLAEANSSMRLTDLALELGYPDTAHFSNSIRRIFGQRPAAIREGTRGMRVWPAAVAGQQAP